MKLYIKIFLASLVLALASCKEDFVDVVNPNSLSPDNYPTTMEHLDQMLNSVYGTQHAFGLYGHDMLGKNVYCWDHTADLEWQGTPTWIDLARNNTRPNDEFLGETWRDSYKGIQRANTLLGAIATYRTKFAVAGDESTLKTMEGELYFLRAWFYFNLINIWGESYIINGQGGDKLGVPIITETASELSKTQKGRATVREVWNYIIDELKKAEAILGDKVWTGAKDKHRAGKWAVKGFLGKAYVFTEDWSNAKTYLKDIIDNSGKSLVTFDKYKDMFNDKHEFNEESIFEINMNVDKSTWGAWGDNSMGSGIGMVIGPSYLNNGGGTGASGWSNVFPHDKNLARFGFNEPVYTFVDNPAFDPNLKNDKGEVIKGYDEKSKKWNLEKIVDPNYITKSLQLRKDKATDPRLYVSVLEPYVDSMVADGMKRPIAHYGNVEKTQHAWSFRKYVNLDGNEYSINVNNGSNFYWLRLADVYLLYAEALIETGQTSEALNFINKVKRRAYGYDPNAVSPVDYSSLSDKTKASDPVLANDPLKYERWAELFGEGHWWFDVCRWRIGDKEAAYYEKVRGGKIEWTDTDYAQPIPQQEIESNAEISQKQNPGY